MIHLPILFVSHTCNLTSVNRLNRQEINVPSSHWQKRMAEKEGQKSSL